MEMMQAIVRWTDRQLHPMFVKSVAQNEWALLGMNPVVAWHGTNDIDDCAKDAFDNGRYQSLDLGRTPLTVPRASIGVFEKAIKDGMDYVCILDDDAYFTDPSASVDKVVRALEVKKFGVLGPVPSYRSFVLYESKGRSMDPVIDDPKYVALGHEAYHVYNVKMLENNFSWLCQMYHELKWISDTPIGLLSVQLGMGFGCYKELELKHKSSFGTKDKLRDSSWMNGLIRNVFDDYFTVLNFAPYYPHPEKARDEITRLYTKTVEGYIKAARRTIKVIDNPIPSDFSTAHAMYLSGYLI